MRGKRLQEWITAALIFEGAPTTVERLTRIIPNHPEPHHVSQQINILKHAQVVEQAGIGSYGKPVWKLKNKDMVPQTDELLDRIRHVESASRDRVSIYSDRDAIRQEILSCLNPAGHLGTRPVLRKMDIMAECPAARSEHEVSQILAEMVRDGKIIGEGSGSKRRYWLPRENQIDLFAQMREPEHAEIEQGPRLVRIVFRRGAITKRRRALNGAVMAAYDRSGSVAEITIDKELLHYVQT